MNTIYDVPKLGVYLGVPATGCTEQWRGKSFEIHEDGSCTMECLDGEKVKVSSLVFIITNSITNIPSIFWVY